MKGEYALSLQEKCINDAISEMRVVGSLTFDQAEMVRRYLNYVYTIGFNRGSKHDTKKRPVIQIEKGVIIQRYESIKEASIAMGVAAPSIDKVLRGINNSCKGFFWKYE